MTAMTEFRPGSSDLEGFIMVRWPKALVEFQFVVSIVQVLLRWLTARETTASERLTI
jgi:hypothetical protein